MRMCEAKHQLRVQQDQKQGKENSSSFATFRGALLDLLIRNSAAEPSSDIALLKSLAAKNNENEPCGYEESVDKLNDLDLDTTQVEKWEGHGKKFSHNGSPTCKIPTCETIEGERELETVLKEDMKLRALVMEHRILTRSNCGSMTSLLSRGSRSNSAGDCVSLYGEECDSPTSNAYCEQEIFNFEM